MKKLTKKELKTFNPTPKEKCEAAHNGQCGECSDTGIWTPCA